MKCIVPAFASQTGDDIIVPYRGCPRHTDVQYCNVTEAGSNTFGLRASIFGPHVKDTIILRIHGNAGCNDTARVTAGFNDGWGSAIFN